MHQSQTNFLKLLTLTRDFERNYSPQNSHTNFKHLWATNATNSGNGCAVNHKQAGILAWVVGDRSANTFQPLWNIVKCWHCFFYLTDGWSVYPMFIEDTDHIVSKTYMTRVEGENTRVAPLSGSITSPDFMLFKVSRDFKIFVEAPVALSEVHVSSSTCINH